MTTGTIVQRLDQAASKADAASEQMRKFVNGTEAEDVATESGPMPTMRKFMAEVRAEIIGDAGLHLGQEILDRQAADTELQGQIDTKASQSDLQDLNQTVTGQGLVLATKATPSDISAAINTLVDGAPADRNTLGKIATQMATDEGLISGNTAALALRVRVDAAQSLTTAQQLQARQNINAEQVGVAQALVDAITPTVNAATGGYRPFASLSALNAYAGSDKASFVAYVTGDGVYTWSGSAWVKSQADHEARIQSNESKLAGSTRILTSVNLLNPATCTDGVRLNTTTGATYASAGYSTSDFVAVTAGVQYKKSDANKIWWYDSAKTALSYVTANTATAPANAAYCRVELATTAKGVSYMLTENSKWPAAYTAYSTGLSIADLVVDSALVAKINSQSGHETRIRANETKLAGAARQLTSVNLLDTTVCTDGKRISSVDGSLYSDVNYTTSDYIAVTVGTTYRKTFGNRISWYDAAKAFISSETQAAAPFLATAPTGAVYCRVELPITSKSTFMLTEQAKWPATYVPYSTGLSISDLIVDAALVDKVKPLLTISKNNTDFISRSSPNLFNVATAISGARVVPASGALVYDYASGVTSDYIPVSGSTTYSQTESNYWAEYDANKQYVTGYTAGASLTVTTQPNTAFVRVTVRNTILPTYMFVQSETPPTVYVPYDRWVFDPTIAITAGDSSSTRWQGKKWNVMGDSITADVNSYWRKISQNLGFATARGYGIGGTALAYRAGDGSALFVDQYMAKRYVNMDLDADLVTVAGGTNDFLQVPLGTYGDTTDTTVFGALHVLMTGLVDMYPTATIAFILPFARYNGLTGVSSIDGTRFQDIQEAIVKMCNKFSLPYFDSRKLPLRFYDADQRNQWTNTSIATGLPDGLHPNQLCHETIIAPIIQKWLLTL